MHRIVGNTVGVPNPQSDWNQTDSTKADYIKNKPIVYTKGEIDEQIGNIETALDNKVDKNEVVDIVLAALPNGDEVSY